MPKTRSGASSTKATQKSLDELPGVSASRTTGGGNRTNERPTEEKPLKRAKADPAHAGDGGKQKQKAAPSSGQKQRIPKQDVSADDSRAIVTSVDTGDTQQRLQTATKQTGLKLKSTGGGGGGGGGGGHPAKEVALDKSEHKHAGPAADKGPAGKARKVKAARAEAEQHPGKIVKINRAPVLTLWAKKVAQREGSAQELPECTDCRGYLAVRLSWKCAPAMQTTLRCLHSPSCMSRASKCKFEFDALPLLCVAGTTRTRR